MAWDLAFMFPMLEMAGLPARPKEHLDGISLTVASADKDSFSIWIIPHTRKMTALCERAVGDAVNLEADILGKYVERFAVR